LFIFFQACTCASLLSVSMNEATTLPDMTKAAKHLQEEEQASSILYNLKSQHRTRSSLSALSAHLIRHPVQTKTPKTSPVIDGRLHTVIAPYGSRQETLLSASRTPHCALSSTLTCSACWVETNLYVSDEPPGYLETDIRPSRQLNVDDGGLGHRSCDFHGLIYGTYQRLTSKYWFKMFGTDHITTSPVLVISPAVTPTTLLSRSHDKGRPVTSHQKRGSPGYQGKKPNTSI
jgi:hypothetical protein